MATPEEEQAIKNFRDYLKIESVHPNPDYDGCVYFLKKIADEIKLQSKVINLDETHPVLIMTLPGECPELPSILLNSHMDVVPAYKEEWDHDPFGGVIDENGDIFGRGAQDMKSVTIAQLEAIRRLVIKGVKLKRTVHVTVCPDEEIGSVNGMAKFVETSAFKKLNVAFDLDEGAAATDDTMFIFKNEKCSWKVQIHCPGKSGHGSLLHLNTAGEKLRIVLDRFMDFRKKEAEKLSIPGITEGEITSVNLTILEGGIQNNVVPTKMSACFDIRVSTEGDHDELVDWIQEVCKEAGEGVYPEFHQKESKAPLTSLKDNPFTDTLVSTLNKLNIKYRFINCYGATDARFARKTGIPALGLSPFLNTQWRFHGHNEYMNSKIFLKGISYYETIIQDLANV